MKIAPLIVGGTLACLLVALATATTVEVPDKFVPIDVAGVEVLELHGGEHGAHIKISATAPAGLTYDPDNGASVTVSRRGTTLEVRYGSKNVQGVSIVVPPQVRLFDLRVRAEIEVQGPPGSVEVRTSSALAWDGVAKHLRVLGRGTGCDQAISIQRGRIDRLEIAGPRVVLSLGQADLIGSALLDLGPHGKISLSRADRIDHLEMKRYPVPSDAGSCPDD